MLHYDWTHWSAFFAAAFLLNISPGPDLAFILGHTARGGARTGMAAMLGIWTGALGHVVMAALGLSAIVAATASAFSVVKWIGVAYLFWLGIKAIRSRGGTMQASVEGPVDGFWAIFRQGALVDLLNPKVAIFFLAFLPQFVVEGQGPVWMQLLLHGVLIIVVASFVEPPLILLGARFSARLRDNRRLAMWIDRTLGALLMGLGLRLALEER